MRRGYHWLNKVVALHTLFGGAEVPEHSRPSHSGMLRRFRYT